MQPTETLGDRIRLLRLARRWSQRRLANEICCSRMTITNWENGITSPGQIYKDKLACVFCVTVEELEGAK